MSKSKRQTARLSRPMRFEPLEERVVLDSQIGSVVMPYDGYLSAAVYDPNGQLVRTLLARAPEENGVSVPIVWDGKNDQGQKVLASGNFTWKALTSQVNVVDQGTMGDSIYTNKNLDPTILVPPDASYSLRNVAVDGSGNLYQISA